MLVELDLTTRLLVGGLFVGSGLSKLLRAEPFAETIAALGWPRSKLLGVLVSAAEFAVGVAFISGIASLAAALAGCLLVAGFIAASLRGLGREVPCHCFGSSEGTLGRHTLLRALLLAVPVMAYGVVGIVAKPRAWPDDVAQVELCVTLALGIVLLVAWALELPKLLQGRP